MYINLTTNCCSYADSLIQRCKSMITSTLHFFQCISSRNSENPYSPCLFWFQSWKNRLFPVVLCSISYHTRPRYIESILPQYLSKILVSLLLICSTSYMTDHKWNRCPMTKTLWILRCLHLRSATKLHMLYRYGLFCLHIPLSVNDVESVLSDITAVSAVTCGNQFVFH